MYASEIWCMSKENEREIAAWERKILRRIYGSACENEEWRVRSNKEIYEIYKGKPGGRRCVGRQERDGGCQGIGNKVLEKTDRR